MSVFSSENPNDSWPRVIDFQSLKVAVNETGIGGVVLTEVELNRIGPMRSSVKFYLRKDEGRKLIGSGKGIALPTSGGFQIWDSNSVVDLKFGIPDSLGFEFLEEKGEVASYLAAMTNGVRVTVKMVRG